jgi:hypothetical protein
MSFLVGESILLSSTPPRKRRVLDEKSSNSSERRVEFSETEEQSLQSFDGSELSAAASSRKAGATPKRPASPSIDERSRIRKRRFGRIVEIEFKNSIQALSAATSGCPGCDPEEQDDADEDPCVSSCRSGSEELPFVVVTEATTLMSRPVSICSYDSCDAVSISAFPHPPKPLTGVCWTDDTLDEVKAMSAFWRDSLYETPVDHSLFRLEVSPIAAIHSAAEGCEQTDEKKTRDATDLAPHNTGESALGENLTSTIDESTLEESSPLVVLEADAERRFVELQAALTDYSVSSHHQKHASCISVGSLAPPPRSRKNLRHMLGSPYLALSEPKDEAACPGADEAQIDTGSCLPRVTNPILEDSLPPRTAMEWTSYRPRHSLAPFASYAVDLPATPVIRPTFATGPHIDDTHRRPPDSAVWSLLSDGSSGVCNTPSPTTGNSCQGSFMNHSPEIGTQPEMFQDARRTAVRNLFKRAMGKNRIISRWKKPKVGVAVL